MGNTKGGGAYENPAFKGTGGDLSKPSPAGGKRSGEYDNSPNREGSDNGVGDRTSRLGGGGTKRGYDGGFNQKDLAVTGHKKSRSKV